MSSIAKILIAVNLILAAAFVGWASNAVSTNNNWKKQFEAEKTAHDKAKADLGTEKSKLAADLNQANDKAGRLQQDLDTANNEVSRLKNENNANSERMANLEASLQKFSNTLEGIQGDAKKANEDRLKALSEKNDAENKAKDAAMAQAAAEGKAAEFEGKFNDATNEIAAKERELATAEKSLNKTKTELDTVVQATGFKLDSVKAMPLIEGKILAIEMGTQPGLVSINRGSADGVERGFTFEIYDGSSYKGQARVEYVYPNMCSAVLVRKVANETIRQGDGAATRL
jgi:membrane-associated HD superfamily phosphohydrolase